jgi:hypothetical protein
MFNHIYNFLRNHDYYTISDMEVKREITTLILVILICIGFMSLFGPSENVIPLGVIFYIFFRYMQRGIE